eukprot:195249_1
MAFMMLLSLTIIIFTQKAQTLFRFGNTQNSNMVLQQEPYRSQVWGFCDPGCTVQLKLINEANTQVIQTVNSTTNNNDNIWLIQLQPMQASFTKYTITAECTSCNNSSPISMNNILFGDVIFCSGQSNMQFTVDQVFNSTYYIQEANNYPNIRIYSVKNNLLSDTVQTEVPSIYENWSIASSKSIGCGNWTCFSAVCWFTGLYTYKKYNYPIGLISSTHSGSPIVCWMPYNSSSGCNENMAFPVGNWKPSNCWNAHVAPFLRTTIRTILWYQGEEDTHYYPYIYEYASCAPIMIRTWRYLFNLYSNTDELVPFGLIQLQSFYNMSNNVTCNNNMNLS